MKFSLRLKLFVLTCFIIVFTQLLSNVLELAFLNNNIEENTIKKYQIIGGEIRLKLERSMNFGKYLESLNYNFLLKGIMPGDIENFHVSDGSGQVIFSLKPVSERGSLEGGEFTIKKTRDSFIISFPLEKDGKATGHGVMRVSREPMKEALKDLVRESVIHSLTIILVILPFLYLTLIYVVERPFKKSLRDLVLALFDRNYPMLEKSGIRSRNLKRADRLMKEMETGNWLIDRNRDLLRSMESQRKIMDKMVERGSGGNLIDLDSPEGRELRRELAKADTLIFREQVTHQVVDEWNRLLEKDREER